MNKLKFPINLEQILKKWHRLLRNLKAEISCDFAKSTLKNWENVAKVGE